jgi:cytochrome c oxidase subunit 2
MDTRFRIFPQQGSTGAWPVDALFAFETLVSAIFVVLIAGLVIYFSLRYRRRSDNDVPPYTEPSRMVEATYIIIPFGLMMIMFFWGGYVYVEAKRAPEHAMQINVVGKQWMWKIQHPEGAREINELHVPMGVPVRLVMTSQDVIHDFGIPAFRIKQDVLPGSYSTEWFEADRTGEYHIFCDQYCGALHSQMIGRVVVMEPAAYQAWLKGAIPDEPPAVTGAKLYQSYGCMLCHGARAPTLAGLYMTNVKLNDGRSVLADDAYLYESIVAPAAKIVAGYEPIMPTFQGQLSEEQIYDLIEYIKSLGVSQDKSMGSGDAGAQSRPSTQPVNGYRPDLMPNQPPARVPPTHNQTGGSPLRE